MIKKRLTTTATMAALALVLFSTPLFSYVVILKDGDQIITREKYRREGNKVYLVLPNGTETFIDAAEVDFAKTEELNTTNIGQARLIEQQADTVFVEEAPPPQPETLRELAGRMNLSLPEVGRREVAQKVPLTTAGFIDLWRLERSVHPDLELTGELGRFLNSQSVEGYKIFKGTAEERALLEMIVNSETAIFKNLEAAAAALIQIKNTLPKKLEALELVMANSEGVRAGQFVLTPETAEELVTGAVEPPIFFYRYVQF